MKERYILKFLCRVLIIIASFTSSLTTYSGLVNSIQLVREFAVNNETLCGLIVLVCVLMQIIFWNYLIDGGFFDDIFHTGNKDFGNNHKALNPDEKRYRELVFIGGAAIIFICSTHFSIIALGGRTVLKEQALDIYSQEISVINSSLAKRFSFSSAKVGALIKNFNARVRELQSYETRVDYNNARQTGVIFRTSQAISKALDDILREMIPLKKQVRAIGFDYEKIINAPTNDLKEYELKINDGFVKNSLATSAVENNYNSILFRMKSFTGNIQGYITLVRNQESRTKNPEYIRRLRYTAQVYAEIIKRINLLHDELKIKSTANAPTQVGNVNYLIYTKALTIYPFIGLAILLDYTLLLFFIPYMWIGRWSEPRPGDD